MKQTREQIKIWWDDPLPNEDQIRDTFDSLVFFKSDLENEEAAPLTCNNGITLGSSSGQVEEGTLEWRNEHLRVRAADGWEVLGGSDWQPVEGTPDIYFDKGKVGIGTYQPQHSLHVVGGDVHAEGELHVGDNLTVEKEIQVSGDIVFNNKALISSRSGNNNIDHIRHNDAAAAGAGGSWHFVSDGKIDAVGNSRLVAGHVYMTGSNQKNYFSGTIQVAEGLEVEKDIAVKGNILFYNKALIANHNGETNIDHIRHNDLSVGGAGGSWHFVSDGKIDADGNSRLVAGHVYMTGNNQSSYFAGKVGVGVEDPQERLHVSGKIATDWSVEFWHSHEMQNPANNKRLWLKKNWSQTLGDYLTLSSTGNSSNAEQPSLIMSKNKGTLFGKGHDACDRLSEEWVEISSRGLKISQGNLTVGTGLNKSVLTGAEVRLRGGMQTIYAKVEQGQQWFEFWSAALGYSALSKVRMGDIEAHDISYSGSLNRISDLQIKEEVNLLQAGIEELRKLAPVSYKYNDFLKHRDPDRKYYGLIAQEVKKAVPELVGSMKVYDRNNASKSKELLTVDHQSLIFLMINAIKELDKEIQNLKNLL